MLGAHNVLEVYEELVTTAAANANQVIGAVLGEEVGAALTTDVRAMGDLLMGGRKVTLVAYNPLGSRRDSNLPPKQWSPSPLLLQGQP